MNTPRGDDAGDTEPTGISDTDPTGIRALLSSLPDPGPMPQELVDRISRSLREEQHRREVTATPAGDDSPSDGVISLDQARHARTPARTLAWLGSAAAVAVGATVAVAALNGGFGGDLDTSAQYAGSPSRASAPAMGAKPTDAEADESTPEDNALQAPTGDAATPAAPQRDGTAAADVAGSILMVQRPVALTDKEAETELAAWWQRAGGSAAPAVSEEQTGVAQCLASLPTPVAGAKVGQSSYTVGSGTLDGDKIVVVVRTLPPPTTAWVLPETCTSSPGKMLLGPVALP